jgi:hypothetical protein
MVAPAATNPGSPSSPVPFLTRPYMSWHQINSWFDHCNPDYSVDGVICTVDGTVARASNGSDPGFPKGYAVTAGGQDYIYYDGHNGFDLNLYYEELLAAASGVVTTAGTDPVSSNSCFGQTVVIDHGNGYSTRYAHMSQVDVTVGESVVRGQHIGISGTSGCSTGPHLHFGLYINSPWTAIDPWGWLGAAGADPWPSDTGDMWLTGNPMDPVPTAPLNVVASVRLEGAVVTWSPPTWDGGDLQSYTVRESPDGQEVTVPASSTSAAFSTITPQVAHTFTVTANTSLHSGPASAASAPLVRPADVDSYEILTSFGGIYTFGQAKYFGNLIDHGYSGPATGLSAMPDGGGYAILTSYGALYTFGDARYYGNLLDHHYPGRAIALSYTPTGNGYVILTDAGTLYTFGDAQYYGNLVDHRYPGRAVSVSYTPTGRGYAILTDFGAIYTFGDAQYFGNLLDHGYPGPAVSLAYSGTGRGYNILTSFGGIYSFGDAQYHGNLVDHGYPGPAVSLARTP